MFSRTDDQYRRSIEEHDKLLARTDGVRSVSHLDLNATPPFNYAHDHFGFRDAGEREGGVIDAAAAIVAWLKPRFPAAEVAA